MRDVLANWLRANKLDDERARLLSALNAAIEDQDRDLRIGPSYLMRAEAGTEAGLERVWRHDILPLLEEHYYGRLTREQLRARFGLAALRAGLDDGSEGDDDELGSCFLPPILMVGPRTGRSPRGERGDPARRARPRRAGYSYPSGCRRGTQRHRPGGGPPELRGQWRLVPTGKVGAVRVDDQQVQVAPKEPSGPVQAPVPAGLRPRPRFPSRGCGWCRRTGPVAGARGVARPAGGTRHRRRCAARVRDCRGRRCAQCGAGSAWATRSPGAPASWSRSR